MNFFSIAVTTLLTAVTISPGAATFTSGTTTHTLGTTALLRGDDALPAGDEALLPGGDADRECFSDYLFVYFTGNSVAGEAIRFATAGEELDFRFLNDNNPVIDSRDISMTGGVRDPFILRRHDGKGFYMTVTDMTSSKGWDSNRGMVLLKSDDLVNWTSSTVHVPSRWEGHEDLKAVWAPQTIYDPEAQKYLVYWSMRHGDGEHIIYYAYANEDFTDLEDTPKPLFIPADGKSCIDGDIILKDGVYHLFYKTEGHGNGIKSATARSLTSGKWEEQPDYKQQTTDAVEGSGVFPVIGTEEYIMMYDVYRDHRYEFCRSKDLVDFAPDDTVKLNFHPRHGTVIPITAAERSRIQEAFPNTESF